MAWLRIAHFERLIRFMTRMKRQMRNYRGYRDNAAQSAQISVLPGWATRLRRRGLLPMVLKSVSRDFATSQTELYTMTDIAPITEIIDEIRAGRMVVLVDEEDRENEGDLVFAADYVTPEAINFMIRHARGLVCLTLTEERCRQLGLTHMARDNKSPLGTNFTVSIEAAEGVTTGISASDRAVTIRAAVKKDAKPADLVQPGHIFPIMARPGGVLVRAGHTEAGCDLAQMAGLTPASVICEIIKEDGDMARLPDLIPFAKEHGLKIG